MISFKNKEFVFDKPLVKGSTDNIATWEFEGDASNILHLQPGCACTAQIKIENNTIKAVYTDNDGANVDQNTVAEYYPKGTIAFSKSIYVYYKDDKDLYVQKGMEKHFNPSKNYDLLTFKGKICLLPDNDCTTTQ